MDLRERASTIDALWNGAQSVTTRGRPRLRNGRLRVDSFA